MTRRELVEQMLRDAGPTGVTTSQFLRAGAGSRFGARVQELRDRGFTIPCSRVRDGEFRYVLDAEPVRPNHDAEGGGEGNTSRGSSPVAAVPAAPLSAETCLFDPYAYTLRAGYGNEEAA